MRSFSVGMSYLFSLFLFRGYRGQCLRGGGDKDLCVGEFLIFLFSLGCKHVMLL